MSPEHEKLIDRYWEAVEFGSTNEEQLAGAELEDFEHKGIRNGTIEEKDVMLKYVLLWD